MMSELEVKRNVRNEIIVSRKYCLLMYCPACRGVGSGPLRVRLTINLSFFCPNSCIR